MGEVQRIFYYHVPHGILCYLFFSINFVASLLVLAWRRNDPARALAADAWALCGAEVGVLYCTVNLVTGPLWARPVWGIWWTWDARLTTTLILWLIYVSYLLVRRFAAGSEMRSLAAVLAVFGAIDMPINYLANRIWRTQHPSPVIGGGPESGMAPPIGGAWLECAGMGGLGAGCFWRYESTSSVVSKLSTARKRKRRWPQTFRLRVFSRNSERGFAMGPLCIWWQRFAAPGASNWGTCFGWRSSGKDSEASSKSEPETSHWPDL